MFWSTGLPYYILCQLLFNYIKIIFLNNALKFLHCFVSFFLSLSLNIIAILFITLILSYSISVYLWAEMHFFLFANWVQVFPLINSYVAESILYNLWFFMAFSILTIVFKILIFLYWCHIRTYLWRPDFLSDCLLLAFGNVDFFLLLLKDDTRTQNRKFKLKYISLLEN